MHHKRNQMSDFVEIYKLQYERIAQHENQRLTFSNFVVAITAAVLTFSSEIELQVKPLPFLLTALLLILINFIAIQFIEKSRFWIKHHQARAHEIIKDHLPEIGKTIAKIDKQNSDEDSFRRPNLQKNLHITIIIITAAYSLFTIWPKLSLLVCSA